MEKVRHRLGPHWGCAVPKPRDSSRFFSATGVRAHPRPGGRPATRAQPRHGVMPGSFSGQIWPGFGHSRPAPCSPLTSNKPLPCPRLRPSSAGSSPTLLSDPRPSSEPLAYTPLPPRWDLGLTLFDLPRHPARSCPVQVKHRRGCRGGPHRRSSAQGRCLRASAPWPGRLRGEKPGQALPGGGRREGG